MDSSPNIADIERIVEQAMALPRTQREQFVESACGSDAALASEVRSLLAHADLLDTQFLAPGAIIADEHEVETALAEARRDFAGQNLGRYRLEHLIAEGAMGQVYRAQQIAPMQRTVAVKIMRFGLHRQRSIARFEIERQALAMMDHPHIARVFDSGVAAGGRPFLVMEYVDGMPITAYCVAHALDVSARIELMIQACQAIQHAHQKGIIHRDLKPENILVTGRGSENHAQASASPPSVRIIDFSIAKPTEQPASRTGMTLDGEVLGTLPYMAPEQLSPVGDEVDTRADIHALAAVLYELLAGRPPYDDDPRAAGSFSQARAQRTQARIPPPSERVRRSAHSSAWLVRALRGDLDWITLRGLEADPARRYQTAAQLADDLQRHLRHEPVSAGPPGAWYRARRFFARNRTLVSAATIIALLVIVSAVGYVTQSMQVLRARHGELLKAYQVAIVAAESALTLGDAPTAQRMLAAAPGSVQRGWEYHHLARRADVSMWKVSAGPGFSVHAVAAVPHARLLAVGLGNGEIRLYDSDTGRLLDTLGRLPSMVTEIAVSSDGRHLVATCASYTAGLWRLDQRTSVPLPNLDPGVRGHAAFAPDRALLALVMLDDRIAVIDLEHHTQPRFISTAAAQSVAFIRGGAARASSDDFAIAAAGATGVDVWDIATGERRAHLPLDNRRCFRLLTDAGQTTLITMDDAGDIRLFAIDDLRFLARWRTGSAMRHVACAPDGSLIAVGTLKGDILLHDPRSPDEVRMLHGHSEFIAGLCFDADRRLYSVSADRTIGAWRPTLDAPDTLSINTDRILNGAIADDGRRILYATQHGVNLLAVDSDGSVHHRTPPLQGSYAQSDAVSGRPALTRDGRLAALVYGHHLALWNIDADTLRMVEHPASEQIHHLQFCADGTRVIVALPGALEVRSADNGRLLRTITLPLDAVYALACSRENLVAACDLPGWLWVGDLDTGRTLFQRKFDRPAASLAFATDSALLALGGFTGEITLIDPRSGDEHHVMHAGTAMVSALAFTSAGVDSTSRRRAGALPPPQRLFAGLRNGMIQVWRLDGLEPLLTLRAHDQPVMRLAKTTDHRLISLGFDGTIHTWDGRPLTLDQSITRP